MDVLSSLGKQTQQLWQSSYPTAIFKLMVNGQDISQLVSSRLIALTITDNRGMETDSIDIELSDHDGLLDIPPRNAVIEAWLGWSHIGLVYKGKYTVTETEHSGVPDILKIRGMSADLKKSLKQKKERSFDDVLLVDILHTVAIEHELEAHVHAKFAQRKVPHLDQNESDANLITRLADEHDAIATIKNGCLLFLPTGSGETVSGQLLPTVEIVRRQGDQHRYAVTGEGEDTTAVKAFYYDDKMAKKLEVVIGDASNQNIKELRHVHRDKQSAELAARAKLNQFKRSAASLSFKLAVGNPELLPEMTFVFTGLKSQIDDIIWLGTNVVHTLDASGGYTTDLHLEIYFPDADDVGELFEDQFVQDKDIKWTGVVVYYQLGDRAVPLTKGDQSNPKHFSYLYQTKAAAQQRLEREFALLDVETGQFMGRNQIDKQPYTGLKTFYEDKNKQRQVVVLGNQSNPQVIDHVYKSKKAAEKALKERLPKLNAKQNMLEQVKTARDD